MDTSGTGRWLLAPALILTLTFTGPGLAQDKPAAETPAAATADKPTPEAKIETQAEAKSKAKPDAKSEAKAELKSKSKAKKDKASKGKPGKDKAVPADPDKSELAKKEEADEPKWIEATKLPKPIRDLHKCAGSDDKVELSHEKYAKSALLLVTCPTARGALTPTMVYSARSANGQGAKRVTFEMLPLEDKKPISTDMLYSTVPAREAFAMAGDPMPNMHVKDETAWIIGSWRPEDRPGVCAVTATWKVEGGKGLLWFWEEAKECQKDQLPNYEIKLDKKPPPLVGR
jgi:hypothetical protein